MDHLHIGAVQVSSVSGVVSVGRTVIRQSGWSGKGSLGAGTLTGDFGAAALGFGVVVDADGFDAPVWAQVGGRTPA